MAGYNLPDQSGLEVARSLRRIRADLPGVIAPGLITGELRAQADAIGVRALVHQENTVDELGPAVQPALATAARR